MMDVTRPGTNERKEVAIVMCDKHTMMKLQIGLQVSKQLSQSDSRVTAKFIIDNERKHSN
jgi:hypothetical protein